MAAPKEKIQTAARTECGNLISGVSGFKIQVSSFQFVAGWYFRRFPNLNGARIVPIRSGWTVRTGCELRRLVLRQKFEVQINKLLHFLDA
jgi:hypothetical protein